MTMGDGAPDQRVRPAGSISKALASPWPASVWRSPRSSSTTFVKNRITHVRWTGGNIADDLLTQMYHNSKKPPGPPPPPQRYNPGDRRRPQRPGGPARDPVSPLVRQESGTQESEMTVP